MGVVQKWQVGNLEKKREGNIKKVKKGACVRCIYKSRVVSGLSDLSSQVGAKWPGATEFHGRNNLLGMSGSNTCVEEAIFSVESIGGQSATKVPSRFDYIGWL